MNKKLLLILVTALLVIGLVSGATMISAKSTVSDPAVSITVTPSIISMEKGAKIAIMGSGLEAEQEVSLLLITADGIKTDLGAYLSSQPVVNEAGAWSTVLNADRYISKKLVTEGVYAISVTDDKYNTLASAPIGFYDAAKPIEELPDWAQVVVSE
jgi:hypothetical protein